MRKLRTEMAKHGEEKRQECTITIIQSTHWSSGEIGFDEILFGSKMMLRLLLWIGIGRGRDGKSHE
jgi:hypothetical protein